MFFSSTGSVGDFQLVGGGAGLWGPHGWHVGGDGRKARINRDCQPESLHVASPAWQSGWSSASPDSSLFQRDYS